MLAVVKWLLDKGKDELAITRDNHRATLRMIAEYSFRNRGGYGGPKNIWYQESDQRLLAFVQRKHMKHLRGVIKELKSAVRFHSTDGVRIVDNPKTAF